VVARKLRLPHPAQSHVRLDRFPRVFQDQDHDEKQACVPSGLTPALTPPVAIVFEETGAAVFSDGVDATASVA
jgi:hypothetical protein